MSAQFAKLIVIGAGNMGQAIVFGALRAGVVPAEQVIIIEPDELRRTELASGGLMVLSSLRELAATGAVIADDASILWAVKPQVFAQVAAEFVGQSAVLQLGTPTQTGISIMAGVTIAQLAAQTGMRRIIRCMPTLAARDGRSATAVACAPGLDSELAAGSIIGMQALASVGEMYTLAEEQLDVFTAVGGSGPAYLFYLAEAMIAEAISQGIDPTTARAAVSQTLLGAAHMLAGAKGTTAADLRAQVTSKGGTTAAAVAILEARGVGASIRAAIAAGTARARELSVG